MRPRTKSSQEGRSGDVVCRCVFLANSGKFCADREPRRPLLVAELPPPALSAADERLVVAGELEPQLRAVGGELDTALLTRDCH